MSGERCRKVQNLPLTPMFRGPEGDLREVDSIFKRVRK
jgi:hypothetical protein